MAGVVQRGRLFAALLVFVTGVLLADMAGAGELPDSPVYTQGQSISLALEVARPVVVLVIIFSIKIVTAIIGRYRQNQSVRVRRFGIVWISAASIMVIPLFAEYITRYYDGPLDTDLLIATVSTFLVLLFSGWLYVYKPRLKSWRFAAVGVVVASALGLLYQWNWGAFITVMIYTGIVLVLSPAFYAGKEL